ncbi:hypothetical protein NRIC_26270 [Enterococcus florum]|uniref:Uncharacterized protein n=1 Tax=Enterococcus florum TaxID=2480627 RepID=A0A4P5PAQ0_9ENTE|nr:LPXTG cell wall anchor domain-containing protein [Enterococcus florum]GCF94736.1 hypothetical protein NRIC_26270 [Enterococcus florum]
MDTTIQIHGQLGVEVAEVPVELEQLPEMKGQLVPRYAVQQQAYPKTGEINQGFFVSLFGVLLVLLAVWLMRELRDRK